MDNLVETRTVTARCYKGREPHIANHYLKWLISKGMPSDTERFLAIIEPEEVGKRFGRQYRNYFIEYLGIPESQCPIQTDKWLAHADDSGERFVIWSRIVHWFDAKACFVALYLADEERWQMDISQIDADPPDRRVEIVTKLALGMVLDLAQVENVRASSFEYPDEKFLEEARPHIERMARQKHRQGKKGKRRGRLGTLSIEALATAMGRGKQTIFALDKLQRGLIDELRRMYQAERDIALKEAQSLAKIPKRP
ncbi:MAG: hypothetical protein AABN34_25970 [Acidobacteriota bacterium]